MPKVFCVALGCAIFLSCLPSLQAQEATAALAELTTLGAQASVIFAGEVMAIVRPPNESTGVVEIRFHVQAAVRGCAASGIYLLREWAGLWSGNAPRYRVGQRVLMLLAAPAAGGLSAPVGGMDGVIPLLTRAAQTPADAAGVVPTDRLVLDLRWIAARRERTVTPGLGIDGRLPGVIEPLAGTAPTAGISLTEALPLLSHASLGSTYAAR